MNLTTQGYPPMEPALKLLITIGLISLSLGCAQNQIVISHEKLQSEELQYISDERPYFEIETTQVSYSNPEIIMGPEYFNKPPLLVIENELIKKLGKRVNTIPLKLKRLLLTINFSPRKPEDIAAQSGALGVLFAPGQDPNAKQELRCKIEIEVGSQLVSIENKVPYTVPGIPIISYFEFPEVRSKMEKLVTECIDEVTDKALKSLS